MLRMFVFAAGFIMIAFAIRFFKDEIMLYKNGVKNEATLILMKPYNHVDINEVRNKVYYVGIEPILEVNNEDKKVIIEYDDYDEFKDLKVGWSSYFLDRVPNATVESLMNVINNLYDLAANGLSGKTLKFGTTNLNKLTADQIAVATNKGWTLT